MARYLFVVVDGFMIKKYLTDESGATAIEYSLLAAILGIGIIGITKSFGVAMTDIFDTVNNGIDNS